MKYWIGTMNRVCTTEDNETLKTEDGWTEVTEEEYDKAYALAWEIACNSFWHC